MKERLVGYPGTQAGSGADPSPGEGERKHQIYDVCGRLGPVVGIGSYAPRGWRLSPHPSSEAQDRTFVFRRCKAGFFSRCLPFICRSGVAAGGLVEAVTQEDGCETREAAAEPVMGRS